MIRIGPDLQEFHLISFFYVQTDVFDTIIHMIIKHCTPLFGREYQMVYQYRYIMAFMCVFSHKHILRRNRRGIQY